MLWQSCCGNKRRQAYRFMYSHAANHGYIKRCTRKHSPHLRTNAVGRNIICHFARCKLKFYRTIFRISFSWHTREDVTRMLRGKSLTWNLSLRVQTVAIVCGSVCLSVCLCILLCVCSFSSMSQKHTYKPFYQIFSAYCLWAWLGHPSATFRSYVMYFRFCGWRQVCT